MLTLPLFIHMGCIPSESGIAEDLCRMLHLWFGSVRGGLAIGTIALMVIVPAIKGRSVAGVVIGVAIALPDMLRRGYDEILLTGAVPGGSSLGILLPPSVVLALHGMIARRPVSRLWLAGGQADADARRIPAVPERLLHDGPFRHGRPLAGRKRGGEGDGGDLLHDLVADPRRARRPGGTRRHRSGPGCGEPRSRQPGAVALAGPRHDPAPLHRDGHVPGRYRDAGDRRAAHCTARAPGRPRDRAPADPVRHAQTTTCGIASVIPPSGSTVFLLPTLAPKEIRPIDIDRTIWPVVPMMATTVALVMPFYADRAWLPQTPSAR